MKLRTVFTSVIVFLYSVSFCHAAGNAEDTKKYFSNLLNSMCMIGDCSERPNPYREDRAEQIIGNSVILAYYSSPKKLDEYNKPLRSMGIEYGHIIPEKLVENAVCQYYGFTQSKYPELEKAAEKRKLQYGYYFLGSGDPGLIDYKVDKVVLQKNGLVRVTGTEEEGNSTPFKAFFKKTHCGGKEHWVLLKVMTTDTPEESDDFNLPEDK